MMNDTTRRHSTAPIEVKAAGVSLSGVKTRIKRGSAPFPNMEAVQ